MATTLVNINVEQQVLDDAAAVLADGDLTVADTLGRILTFISVEKQLPPLDCFEPSPETLEAMAACERGDLVSFNSVAELMADLNADDQAYQ